MPVGRNTFVSARYKRGQTWSYTRTKLQVFNATQIELVIDDLDTYWIIWVYTKWSSVQVNTHKLHYDKTRRKPKSVKNKIVTLPVTKMPPGNIWNMNSVVINLEIDVAIEMILVRFTLFRFLIEHRAYFAISAID